jgi:hypothetical protein
MELAGKYAVNTRQSFTPDVFPNQQLMQTLANQSSNPELKDAALAFQYPFKAIDLQNSKYSQGIKQIIMQATIGALK